MVTSKEACSSGLVHGSRGALLCLGDFTRVPQRMDTQHYCVVSAFRLSWLLALPAS